MGFQIHRMILSLTWGSTGGEEGTDPESVGL
jgi:hypothetical protein